jgi:hypothetical protein
MHMRTEVLRGCSFIRSYGGSEGSGVGDGTEKGYECACGGIGDERNF